MFRILIVEDDTGIIKPLAEFLQKEGFETDCASGQAEALKKFEKNQYDIALLDISLKDGNGFVVCSAIKQTTDTPVIFLTASGDEHSVVTGLDIGADDYISKPFRPRELVSRINSVLRRANKARSVIKIENITVDTETSTVTKNGEKILLSALEYKLLLVFLNNKGRVLTRTQLLENIWDVAGDFVNDNTLTVYIKRLREKIEDNPANPTVIKTVRGIGYKVGD